jgi:DNA-binding GntR family transcriptional regulator
MSWPSRADRIEHAADVLLWRQVADDLQAMIEAGELPPGSRLPSDPELAEIYGVARSTTRRAVAELRKEGRLVVIHGRGTFVARKR